MLISQFRCNKIQSETVDITTRLLVINSRVYIIRTNLKSKADFTVRKLIYFNISTLKSALLFHYIGSLFCIAD